MDSSDLRQKGLSIVEIAVTIAILGIVMAAGGPAFSSFMANSQVRSAAESIQTGLQLARAEAIRRNTNIVFDLNPTPDMLWRVCCDTAGRPVETRSRSEANGVALAVTPALPTSFTFNGLGRVANWNLTWGSVFPILVDRPATSDTRSMQVELNVAGSVRVCHPEDLGGGRIGCKMQVR